MDMLEAPIDRQQSGEFLERLKSTFQGAVLTMTRSIAGVSSA